MIKKISFIGSGNVAYHLSHRMKDAGFAIHQIYSRNIKNAMGLALSVDAAYTDKIENIFPDADMYIIAVKDDVLELLAQKINFNPHFVVHTSGSVNIQALENCSSNIGVFYPLQSFKKDKEIDWNIVPICIEANNAETSIKLKNIAEKISKNVHFVNSDNRIKLHIAAIFMNNFTNFMLTISKNILAEYQLPKSLLEPLLKETKEKLNIDNPELYQTGPAKRQDIDLIEKHIEILANDVQKKQLYALISKEIMEYYQSKLVK